jgi:hypothetical protein
MEDARKSSDFLCFNLIIINKGYIAGAFSGIHEGMREKGE